MGVLSAVLASGVITGCASTPPPPPVVAPPPTPSPDVFFYPLQGQGAEQQDRDRYECYLWARQRTGFDPSRMPPGQPPVRVVAIPPPGHDAAVGAATGAVIGAAVSQPWHTGEGAAIGAVAGAVLGASSDANRQQQAEQAQAQQDEARRQRDAQVAATVESYRRAMQACLQGRGYAVR